MRFGADYMLNLVALATSVLILRHSTFDMVISDLNIKWPKLNYDELTGAEVAQLTNVIVTAYDLGYFNQVINFEIDESLKFPGNGVSSINPIKVAQFIDIDKFPELKVFTRLTIVVNDSSRLVNLNKYQNNFDILAIKPVNEKSLQHSIINLNIDLISIPLDTKLNFYLKHKIIGKGLDKGIKFEVCYGPLISSQPSSGRKLMISNLIQLIRATRSNGLVISSGAVTAINIRAFNNIINFFETLGLRSNYINKFNANAESVLTNGRLRINSYKQTVVLDDNKCLYDNTKDEENNVLVNNYKKTIEQESKRRKLK